MNQGGSVHFYMCDLTGNQSIVGIFALDPFKLNATIHAVLNLLLVLFHCPVRCLFIFRLLFQCSYNFSS